MPGFTGSMRLKVCEAMDLKPTGQQLRHLAAFGRSGQMVLDPYITVDVDDNHIQKTTTKQKTLNPVWNEYINADIQDAEKIIITVFHDGALQDDFVANCMIPLDELYTQSTNGSTVKDIWVSITRKLFHPFGVIRLFILTPQIKDALTS